MIFSVQMPQGRDPGKIILRPEISTKFSRSLKKTGGLRLDLALERKGAIHVAIIDGLYD